jgi:hypothetical protein
MKRLFLIICIISTHAYVGVAQNDQGSFPRYGFTVALPNGWHAADTNILRRFTDATRKGVVAHAKQKSISGDESLDNEILLFCSKHALGARQDNPNVTISVERVWDSKKDHSGEDYLHLLAERFVLLKAPSTLQGQVETVEIAGSVFSTQDAINRRVRGVETKQQYITTCLDGYYVTFVISYNDKEDADYRTMRSVVESFRRKS